MSKPIPFRGALIGLFATLSVISCGGGSDNADPYNGVVFTSDGTNSAQFDSKFLAQTCTASSSGPACRSSATKYACATGVYNCYTPQQGYANGSAISFYNLVSLSTGIVPVKNCNLSATVTRCPSGTIPLNIPVSAVEPIDVGGGGAHVDIFPHSCAPGRPFNQVTDAYATSSQFAIFNNLPFSLTSNQVLDGAFDYPIVASYGVTLTDNETCNDLKDSRSIADASNPGGGSFGATRTAQPTAYQLWAPIDVTSTIVPLPNTINTSYGAQYGWYRGLLLRYFDGGPIPTTTTTNPDGTTTQTFVAMDGLIIDPASTSSFADPTDPKVILLPAAPGDANYSPIVHLHDYHLQTGQSVGSVTSICLPGQSPCPSTSADYTKASATSFYTIFIASTPQSAQ